MLTLPSLQGFASPWFITLPQLLASHLGTPVFILLLKGPKQRGETKRDVSLGTLKLHKRKWCRRMWTKDITPFLLNKKRFKQDEKSPSSVFLPSATWSVSHFCRGSPLQIPGSITLKGNCCVAPPFFSIFSRIASFHKSYFAERHLLLKHFKTERMDFKFFFCSQYCFSALSTWQRAATLLYPWLEPEIKNSCLKLAKCSGY